MREINLREKVTATAVASRSAGQPIILRLGVRSLANASRARQF